MELDIFRFLNESDTSCELYDGLDFYDEYAKDIQLYPVLPLAALCNSESDLSDDETELFSDIEKDPPKPFIKQGNSIPLDNIIRIPNNFTIPYVIENFKNVNDITYHYFERKYVNQYQTRVIRKSVNTKPGSRSKWFKEGLCPYCTDINFLLIDNSLYLHHLTIVHGLFSNGVKVEDPICDKDGVKCPLECCEMPIRLRGDDIWNPRRYQKYCRHVLLCHYQGRRLK